MKNLQRLLSPKLRHDAVLRQLLRHGVLALAASLLSSSGAVAQNSLEARVKAAYLYRFLTYVEWPASDTSASGGPRAVDAPLMVGVIGAEQVHAELQMVMSGRQVNGRPLTARKLSAGEPLTGLHALYVGGDAPAATLLGILKGRPVLVVTDIPTGLPEGAILNFLIIEGRVRFEASAANAERAGLRLSARLLAVAERVVPP